MSYNGNNPRLVWAAILSVVLNVILFGYISIGFAQTQSERARAPLEAKVDAVEEKTARHDDELKALEVSLEGIRQQLARLQEDVREIKEAVK